MEDREEILKALKVIQSVCKSHSNCDNCPFSIDGCCEISYKDPENWKIRQRAQRWTAFED